jgi:hypothetical protein
MLEDDFGAVVIDDGLILRRALPILTGIDADAPFTQEGKATIVTIGERTEAIRQGLGELGNYLEARYGDFHMPQQAMRMAREEHPTAPFYVYPSCRKNQGRAYKMAGGVVIQIDRPGFGPSGNAFDVWDADLVDVTIDNSGSIDDLREMIHALPGMLNVRYG